MNSIDRLLVLELFQRYFKTLKSYFNKISSLKKDYFDVLLCIGWFEFSVLSMLGNKPEHKSVDAWQWVDGNTPGRGVLHEPCVDVNAWVGLQIHRVAGCLGQQRQSEQYL